MPLFARVVQTVPALFLGLSLAACGGGGDSSAELAKLEARVAPFLGHWVGCWAPGSSTSEKDDLHVTMAGDGKVTITRTYTQHNGSQDCSTAPFTLEEEKSVLTLLGETTVLQDPALGSVSLEKFTRTGEITTFDYSNAGNGALVVTQIKQPAPSSATASVLAGSPPRMVVGDSSKLDPQGNPAALLPLVYVKQPS